MKITSWMIITILMLLDFMASTAFAKSDIPAICSAAYSKVRDQINERVDEYYELKATKVGFQCGGLEVIDYASALDGELYYVNATTRELISICGMGLYISVPPNKFPKCSEICPPMQWRSHNCEEQYSKYLKTKHSQVSALGR